MDELTITECALLGMLARYGERSGYELLKLANTGIAWFWAPAKSHVYDVLPRLERGSYAHRRPVRQTGKPDKHLWRITPRGRAALKDWVNAVDENPLSNRGVLLLKLFFGAHGDPERLVAHLERFHEQAAARLAALRAIDAETPRVEADELPLLTLRQGLIGTEAQLRWAEEALPKLRARAQRLPRTAPARSGSARSTKPGLPTR